MQTVTLEIDKDYFLHGRSLTSVLQEMFTTLRLPLIPMKQMRIRHFVKRSARHTWPVDSLVVWLG